jgi:hypothetical protein
MPSGFLSARFHSDTGFFLQGQDYEQFKNFGFLARLAQFWVACSLTWRYLSRHAGGEPGSTRNRDARSELAGAAHS